MRIRAWSAGTTLALALAAATVACGGGKGSGSGSGDTGGGGGTGGSGGGGGSSGGDGGSGSGTGGGGGTTSGGSGSAGGTGGSGSGGGSGGTSGGGGSTSGPCGALAPSIDAGRALRVDPEPVFFGPARCWRATTSPSGQLAFGSVQPSDHRVEAWFDLYAPDGSAHQGTIHLSPYTAGSNLDEWFHPTSAGWAGIFEGGLRAYDSSGNTLSGFHEAVDTAPDAHGGTVAIVVPMFPGAPSSPRALVWVSPSGGVLRVAPLDAYADLLLVSWTTDHVLAIDVTPSAGPSARWYDGNGSPLTPWFGAGPPFQSAPSMHLLVDGSIAVGDAQGWRVFRDGVATLDAPPAWLAARAGMRLATIRDGRGYAVLPPAPRAVDLPAAGRTSFEVVTADGEGCGTFQLPAPADEPGVTRTPAVLDVGQDGTLVQAETLAGQALGGGTHCELRWWPALLR